MTELVNQCVNHKKGSTNLVNFIDMAKNIGLIKFSGGLGDMVGYYRCGNYVVQRKGGPTSKRLKEDACYEGVRKRQTEFGRCSKISSMFKAVFDVYLSYIPTPMMFNWINSMVMRVKNCDLVSEKGAKTFLKGLETEAGRKLFNSFEFNNVTALREVVAIEDCAVFETGVLTFRVVDPKNFKNSVLGVSLVVLSVEFDQPNCTVYSDGLTVYDVVDEAITVGVALPEKKGFCIAFLYVAKGLPSGDDFVWLRDNRNVLGVVAFD